MATRITDGKKTVEITMCVWNGTGWTPDFSNDFFCIGDLRRDNERDAYIVGDVDYCIDQADDWKHSRGDFADDIPNVGNEVFVKLIEGGET